MLTNCLERCCRTLSHEGHWDDENDTKNEKWSISTYHGLIPKGKRCHPVRNTLIRWYARAFASEWWSGWTIVWCQHVVVPSWLFWTTNGSTRWFFTTMLSPSSYCCGKQAILPPWFFPLNKMSTSPERGAPYSIDIAPQTEAGSRETQIGIQMDLISSTKYGQTL